MPEEEKREGPPSQEEFEKLLGPMHPQNKDEALQTKIEELHERMINDEWLHQKGRRLSGRDIKIRAGINVVHNICIDILTWFNISLLIHELTWFLIGYIRTIDNSCNTFHCRRYNKSCSSSFNS